MAVAVGVYLVVRVFTGNGTFARAIRTARLVNAVTTEYRVGNYEAALRQAERLKDGDRITAEYCFMTGSLLHHLGQFTEAGQAQGRATFGRRRAAEGTRVQHACDRVDGPTTLSRGDRIF